MEEIAEELIDKFWSGVNKTDKCWLWNRALDQKGYGVLYKRQSRNRYHLVHRLSWVLHYGPVPPGLFVCHHCDIRHCVNPLNLFVGTHFDNNHDCKNKGRTLQGERANGARLKIDQVVEMRALRTNGAKLKELANKFDIRETTVSRICRRTEWSWL
jgi:hypothetical protein